jgi:hypothetical protein
MDTNFNYVPRSLTMQATLRDSRPYQKRSTAFDIRPELAPYNGPYSVLRLGILLPTAPRLLALTWSAARQAALWLACLCLAPLSVRNSPASLAIILNTFVFLPQARAQPTSIHDNMSGLEVAGIVLGVIPLVISALEHYKGGRGVASSIVKWRGHLDTLIFRLKLQRTFFYLHILELLRAADVVDLEDCVDLTEEECIVILRDAKTAKEFQEYLGSLYGTFLEVLGRYETCLKTIVGKIGHISRIPDV